MKGVVLPVLGYLLCVRRFQRDKVDVLRLSFHLSFLSYLSFRRNLMNGVVLSALGYLLCMRRFQRDKLGVLGLSFH
jgi:hypothetical protein